MTRVRDRSLNVVLWIWQLVLAAIFGMSGFAKVTSTIAALSGRMPWVVDVPPMLVHFTGACEIAGAVGLILPALTGIQPGLTALAAAGLTTQMALASLFHFGRGEFDSMLVTVPLALASALVAWGRMVAGPQRERLRV
jgi:putative oxidoreductase